MSKPILRVGKIKTTGRSTPASVGAHLARSRPTPNADPKRTSSNVWIVGSAGMDLDAAITDVMTRAKIDRTKIRKDAVVANDILLSVSPEWFRPNNPEASGTYDQNRLKVFTAEAERFLQKQFPGGRVVAAVLHLDERTPHVQAVVVPIMAEKGKPRRLSSKDCFNPERLKHLQQVWEDQLRPHGVGPRTPGSRARHTTLREYYSALEATRSLDKRPTIELTDPPKKRALETAASHSQRVDEWKKAEKKRLGKELRPLAIAASRGRLYDAERLAGVALRTQLADQAESLSRAYDQLGNDKNLIARLRAAPINQVAAALGYGGEIQKGENSIDLVKRVGELNYQQAVGWLAQHFGADVAAATVREEVQPIVQSDKPILLKGDRVKLDLVGRQLDALAAPAYRISTTKEKADGETFGANLGKDLLGKDHLTRQEVLSLVPRLAKYNAAGFNILITPIERGDVHHVLVDDVKPDGLKELRARGYTPALIMETSKQNHQVVVKVSGKEEAVNEWFKDVNRDLGDAKIVGLVHPMRLAGFENRKSKHQGDDGRFPFVQILHAVNQLCERSAAVVQTYLAQLRLPGSETRSTATRKPA